MWTEPCGVLFRAVPTCQYSTRRITPAVLVDPTQIPPRRWFQPTRFCDMKAFTLKVPLLGSAGAIIIACIVWSGVTRSKSPPKRKGGSILNVVAPRACFPLPPPRPMPKWHYNHAFVMLDCTSTPELTSRRRIGQRAARDAASDATYAASACTG